MATRGQQAFLWIFMIAVAVGALALGWYIHLNASEWEPSLTGVGALITIVGVVGWWRGPKRLQWTSAALGWIGFVSAFVFGLFHGWLFVAVAAIGIPMIAVNIVLSTKISRLHRAVDEATLETFSTLAYEASLPVTPNPHEDVGAVKVYPDRARLARFALGWTVIVAMLTGCILFCLANLDSDPLRAVPGLISCALLVPYAAIVVIASIIQLAHPRPIVALRQDGIVNNSGPFGDGPGLVQWREIVAMYIRGPSSSWLSRRMLVLIVANPSALVARESPLTRILQRLYAVDKSSPVVIPERVLPISLDELEEKMRPYLKRAHGDKWGDDDFLNIELDPNIDQAQD